MEEKLIATVGAKTKWQFRWFLFIAAGCTALPLIVAIDSWGIAKLGTKLGMSLCILASCFLCYKVWQALSIMGGVLILDRDQLTWTMSKKVTSIDMNDVHSIDIIEGEASFYVLKDLVGKELIRFSASLDSGGARLYEEIHKRMQDDDHNKTQQSNPLPLRSRNLNENFNP